MLIDEDLLDEVTALVEWPVVIIGSFNDEYLELPREALIATMQSHQKYFPVLHPDTGELTADFISVANIDSASPEVIKQGNERVISPRLSDAAFFWERDRSRPLESFAVKTGQGRFRAKAGYSCGTRRRVLKTSADISRGNLNLKQLRSNALRGWRNATC